MNPEKETMVRRQHRGHQPFAALAFYALATTTTSTFTQSQIQAEITTSPLTEREILEELYFACNGPNWTRNTNWVDPGVSICRWYGIKCTCADGESDDIGAGGLEGCSVKSIKLKENSVVCTLPTSVFLLPELVVLDMRRNGDLDVKFDDIEEGAAQKIKILNFNEASISSIQGLNSAFNKKRLRSLGLAGNDLSGPFPIEVLDFENLEQLDLSYNFLAGAVPWDIGTLLELKTLNLAHNFFEGGIPESVGNLVMMCVMDLSHNFFNGTIPSSFGNLTMLTLLSLNNQRLDEGGEATPGLTGPVYDFSTAPNLSWLNLANNGLDGQIPASLLLAADPWSFFTMVDLSANNVVGNVPQELVRFQVLRIYLLDNNIQGIAPDLCNKDAWFFGEVGHFGCNAILCPEGTFSVFGRQISDDRPCQPCPEGFIAPNFGSTRCVDASLVLDIQARHEDSDSTQNSSWHFQISWNNLTSTSTNDTFSASNRSTFNSSSPDQLNSLQSPSNHHSQIIPSYYPSQAPSPSPVTSTTSMDRPIPTSSSWHLEQPPRGLLCTIFLGVLFSALVI